MEYEPKVVTVNGKRVTLFTRDGKNYSSNKDELPVLEEASAQAPTESPFWDVPKNRNAGSTRNAGVE